MKANYGYMDGSGEFYITIDTDLCIECSEYGCVAGCPSELFEIIIDDYDDEVAAIKEAHRKKVKYDCASCKPNTDRPPLPCIEACPASAISHSW